jgi:hypothetical protein
VGGAPCGGWWRQRTSHSSRQPLPASPRAGVSHRGAAVLIEGGEAPIAASNGSGELLLQPINLGLLHLELASEIVEHDLVRRHILSKRVSQRGGDRDVSYDSGAVEPFELGAKLLTKKKWR